MRGRKEICREIIIDKQKLFKQAPVNIRECQMEEKEIPNEDLDEEAIEPRVEAENSQEQIKKYSMLGSVR